MLVGLNPFDDLTNPRLNDALGLDFTQEDVDFAIPRLTRDIPLAIDPFLLWKSRDPAYRALHARMIGYFDQVRELVVAGHEAAAQLAMAPCGREAEALGLGTTARSKKGRGLSDRQRAEIRQLFIDVPQLGLGGLTHLEIIGLVVPGIAEDLLSDTAASLLRSFLLEYSSEQALKWGIPTEDFRIDDVLDLTDYAWRPETAQLPFHPETDRPLLLVPLNTLRHLPWINYTNYSNSPFAKTVLPPKARQKLTKPQVQARNREKFEAVEGYVADREADAERCTPDPLFKPMSNASLKRRLRALQRLQTGRADGADQEFEKITFDVLATLLHPAFELADRHERTVGGVHIRDMIFYNSARTEFARDLKQVHGSVQVVAEFKNVKELKSAHIDQLYRYLGELAGLGRFGILVCRNVPSAAMRGNLWHLYVSISESEAAY